MADNQKPHSSISGDWLETILDRFEQAWANGERPEIEDFVTGEGSDRQKLLLELLKSDLEFRLKEDPAFGIEVYLDKYPAIAEQKDGQLIDLIKAEMQLRRSVSVDEYLKRFPNLEKPINGLFNDLTLSLKNAEGNADDRPSENKPNESKPSSVAPDIENYQILELIAEGGMGSVWRASQTAPIRRQVAIKVIKRAIADKEVIARFEAERQALAMMDHQNIAKVLDAGTTDDGNPFFVMELVKGVAFTQYCDEKKLSINERLELFVPVCNAIQHAHQKGIIHRDLKPSNVLVTFYDGKPVAKVIDFGLAKALEHTTKLTDKTMFTEFGKIVGTVQYMSPEQAEMSALDVDTRTDVYSLGVMLYELLTGSTPLDKETVGQNALLQILAIIREKEPPRPSYRLSSFGDSASGISEQRKITPSRLQQILRGELDWIVMKALEKDRTRRYETANGLALDIERYLADEPIFARPPSTVYRFRKFLKKHRGVVTTTAMIVVLLLAGIIGTSWFAYQANESALQQKRFREIADKKTETANRLKNESDTAKNDATEARQLAKEEAKRAKELEASAKFRLANAHWEKGRVFDARVLLHEIPHELRNFEWHYCNRHFVGGNFTCYGHTGPVTEIAFSPDGTQIVSAGDDTTIKIWDSTTGELIRTLQGHTKPINALAISPGGTLIVSTSDDTKIKIWDATTGREIKTLNGQTKGINVLAFNPDGTKILSANDEGITFWDSQTGEEIKTVSCTEPAFSPDLSLVAIANSYLDPKLEPLIDDDLRGPIRGSIKIWDVSSSKETKILKGYYGLVSCVSFSPDGKKIAARSEVIPDPEIENPTPFGHTIKIWDVVTGNEIKTWDEPGYEVSNVAFSPDGKRVVSTSRDRIKIWDTESGEEMTTISANVGFNSYAKFSPDGTKIVLNNRELSDGFYNEKNIIEIWDAKTGYLIKSLKGHMAHVTSVAFSPDGKRMASASRDNTIKVWDMGISEGVYRMITMPNYHDVGPSQFQNVSTYTENIFLDTKVGFTNDFAFSPDGTGIVVAGHPGVLDGDGIKILNASTGKEIKSFKGHQHQVTCVAFSQDGKKIVSGSEDNTIKIWDVSTGSEIKSLVGHSDIISSVAISPDDTKIVSTSDDRTIKLWDAITGSEIKSLDVDASFAAFSPDGSQFVSGLDIKIWDTATCKEIKTLDYRWGYPAYSPNGKSIVFATPGMDRINILDATSGEIIQTLFGPPGVIYNNVASFSPDGTRIVAGGRRPRVDAGSWTEPGIGNYDCTVRLWDAFTGEEINGLYGLTFDTDYVAFSPDGTRIAALEAGTIEIWNAPRRAETKILVGHSSWVESMAFSPDGKRIATGSVDRSIKIWDIKTGKELKTLEGHNQTVKSLSFNPDGSRIYSIGETEKSRNGSSQDVETLPAEKLVWDIDKGIILKNEPWLNFDSDGLSSNKGHQSSADGRWLASIRGRSVFLVDTEYKNTPREKAYREFKSRNASPQARYSAF